MTQRARVKSSIVVAVTVLASLIILPGPIEEANAVPVSVSWTTRADFESGSEWNVDTASSPGNVTLVPSPTDWVKAQSNPVLDLGPAGSWEDTLVVYPAILRDGDGYKMWYAGYDGPYSYRIGYATSADGLAWTRQGRES